jgi:hypothetical protein
MNDHVWANGFYRGAKIESFSVVRLVVDNVSINPVVPKLGAAKYSTRPTNYDLFIQ